LTTTEALDWSVKLNGVLTVADRHGTTSLGQATNGVFGAKDGDGEVTCSSSDGLISATAVIHVHGLTFTVTPPAATVVAGNSTTLTLGIKDFRGNTVTTSTFAGGGPNVKIVWSSQDQNTVTAATGSSPQFGTASGVKAGGPITVTGTLTYGT